MSETNVTMHRTAEKAGDDANWFGISMIATGVHYHEPMVMYYSDGSGYPGHDEIDVVKLQEAEIEITWGDDEHYLCFTLTDDKLIEMLCDAWGIDPYGDQDDWSID